MSEPTSVKATAPRAISLWRIGLALHFCLAAGWWWMMPGGFPWGHARFWANRGLPLLVAAAVVVALVAGVRRNRQTFQALVAAGVVGWTAALVVAVFVFPFSSRRFLLPVGAGVAFLWGLYRFSFRGSALTRSSRTMIVVLAGFVGGAAVLLQRAATPETKPLDLPLPNLSEPIAAEQAPTSVDVGENASAMCWAGSIRVRSSALTVEINPLLTFISRSPDRCWTIFAPRRQREEVAREFQGMESAGGQHLLSYRDLAQQRLRLATDAESGATTIEVFADLDGAVYSHLNSYCEVMISGHHRLSLSFSPCADYRAEVLPADYPVGRPARLAYRDANDGFHVVEARSGEKGPFRALASGKLARGEPLVITLYDEDAAACQIEFADWAAQASTALSPTAGWGVTEGAIEFQRLGEREDAAAVIWLTLAGTSVGRGWDSVGHAAGVYRNRMRVSPIRGKP